MAGQFPMKVRELPLEQGRVPLCQVRIINHQLEQAEVAAVRQMLQERPPRPRAKLIYIGP
jgi:hypothetical protein